MSGLFLTFTAVSDVGREAGRYGRGSHAQNSLISTGGDSRSPGCQSGNRIAEYTSPVGQQNGRLATVDGCLAAVERY